MNTTTYFEDIHVDQQYQKAFLVTEDRIHKFAEVTGDTNPLHIDPEYAATTQFGECIAHGMLSASFISAVLGTQFPGNGAVYLSQTLQFKRPVKIGSEVSVTITVIDKSDRRGMVTMKTVCTVNGKTVVEGKAVAMVPKTPA